MLAQNYKVSHQIGQGAFSKVKIGTSLQDNKEYAIKIFNKYILRKKKKMKQGKYISEFEIVLNELNIHLQLNHENIIKIYSVLNDDDKDKIYFILEYCSQGTLLNWNEDEQIFTGHEFQNKILLDIVLGLKYMHDNNYVHFDIKPQNILINSQNRAMLCDFGTTLLLQENDEKVNYCQGTCQFLAPETMVSQSFYPKPCDIWALGVTIFCYYYKKLPWYDDIIFEQFQKILKDDLEFPEQECQDLKQQQQLKSLLKKMLNKDPHKRITINEVLQSEYFKNYVLNQ